MNDLFSTARFYNWIAPFYAPAQRLLPVWRRYTEAVLPWLPHTGAVLEIGPGPGVLLSRLAGRYPLAIGLDRSAAMVREAQRRLRRAHRPTRVVQGDATRLPFPAASFDAVTLTFALSAIPDGLQAVREMARLLRPGGVLVLVDAGYPADGNWLGTALAHMWEKFGDYMRDEAGLMSRAGLDIVQRQEFGVADSIRLVVGRKAQQ